MSKKIRKAFWYQHFQSSNHLFCWKQIANLEYYNAVEISEIITSEIAETITFP